MSIESIRKGCLFCQKWYIEWEGVGLRAVSLYKTLLRTLNKTNFRVAVSANLFATFSEFFSSPHSLHVPYFVHVVDDVQDIKEHIFGNEFSAHSSIRAIAEENTPCIILILNTPIRPRLKNYYQTSTHARPAATTP